jgi:L-aspartate semialdehyde sulfurtransferase
MYTGVSDKELFTKVVDYGSDYSNRIARDYGEVSYHQLKSGTIIVNGQEVQTAPLSSMVKAREIAESLKKWILEKRFFINKPAETLPGSP